MGPLDYIGVGIRNYHDAGNTTAIGDPWLTSPASSTGSDATNQRAAVFSWCESRLGRATSPGSVGASHPVAAHLTSAIQRNGDRPADDHFHQVEVMTIAMSTAVLTPVVNADEPGDCLRIPDTGDYAR